MVDIKKGSFSAGSYNLFMDKGSIKVFRTTAKSTNDNEFPAGGGPDNVIINNSSSSGITLHARRTINGNCRSPVNSDWQIMIHSGHSSCR